MDVLVVDLTHGGVKIAVELEKLDEFDNIYAYDIYGTLKEDEKYQLNSRNIELLGDNNDIISYVNDIKVSGNKLLVINPIHSFFNIFNLIGDNFTVIEEITHHQAINLILKRWKERINHENVPVIEVTGVKGKTSVVAMLKEIFRDKSPLVLSSLGANLYKDDKKLVLKKNISITPANILETVKLAKKVANPDCVKIVESNESIASVGSNETKNSNWDLCYGACIFESSLGVSGLGDVGVLTNIVENYSISKGSSNAKKAKEQVFNCDIVVIEEKTLNQHYFEKNKDNSINTFGFDNKNANLFVDNVKFGLNNTNIKINYNNIVTTSGNTVNGFFTVDTFAPGKHNVLNVLAAVTTALSYDVGEDIIKNGLANFKGIKGRTSLKMHDNLVVIEEINPGINTKAIESSINMINNLNDYVVILGGKFGVTCEEIDESKVAKLLDNILNDVSCNDFNLVLTDDLGKEIEKRMENTVEYVKDPIEAQNLAIKDNKNVLFIYRSNYSQISKR